MTVYLQDKSGNSGADCEFKKNVQANSKLLPKDELYLRISSFDQDKYNVFSNMQVNSQLGSEGVNLVSYTVSDSGTIRLAMVGDVYVENLTLEEAARKIESALDIYMNQPMVTVKLVDKTITVLGEVNVPGTFSFTKENLTVFQALGYAGGMKPFANRQKVTIMREQQETILKETIDLTNQEVIMSDYYYVLDDDVIM
ncbi:MAG: hypothetical protein HC896_04260 [Bacteroidales bacterium]|nr:hypothetical protein [Bacteroidales bacterium]